MGVNLSLEDESEQIILQSISDYPTFSNEHFFSKICKLALIEKKLPFQEKKLTFSEAYSSDFINNNKHQFQFPILKIGSFRQISSIFNILRIIDEEPNDGGPSLSPKKTEELKEMQFFIKMILRYTDIEDLTLSCTMQTKGQKNKIVALLKKKIQLLTHLQEQVIANDKQENKQNYSGYSEQTHQFKEQNCSQSRSENSQDGGKGFFSFLYGDDSYHQSPFSSLNNLKEKGEEEQNLKLQHQQNQQYSQNSISQQNQELSTKASYILNITKKKIQEIDIVLLKLENLEYLYNQNMQYLNNSMHQLENKIIQSGGPFLLGSQYTLADVVLTGFLNKLKHLNLLQVIQQYPNIYKYFEQIQQRESYKRAGYESKNIYLDQNKKQQIMKQAQNLGISLFFLLFVSASLYSFKINLKKAKF